MAVQVPIKDVVKNTLGGKSYRANLIGARVGITTPNLATLVFKFIGSGKIVIWQIRDTKWEKPKPAEGEAAATADPAKKGDKAVAKTDYGTFGEPRKEFIEVLKKILGDKAPKRFNSMQSTKDALGNGPTQFFDIKGEDYVAGYMGGDFKASLKY